MIKKIFYSLLFLTTAFSQFREPININFSYNDNITLGEVVELEINISLEEGWKIYAVYGVVGGPTPSSISVDSPFIDKIGKVIEPIPIKDFDEGFQVETKFHKGTFTMIVPIQISSNISIGDQISFFPEFEYQVCNETICYPPNIFSEEVIISVINGNPNPAKLISNFDFDSDSILNIVDNNILSFLILALSMGFLALLTPCVFPMVPITISYFTHRAEHTNQSAIKDATVYMFGIIGTFTVLGMLLAIILGASGANQIAANPYVNIFIAALFIYFSFSLFGFYEIEIPESLRRFSLQKESSKGFLGILFMALTFTLTSFTCTVQFMGLILVAASQGEWFWPIIGMLVFSTAFASPFFFLALFPKYLTQLPQSGSWLNNVKVVMGFLELAAAFKFISNSDLVWNWNIFSYDVVLFLWSVLMLLTAIYLFGLIRFRHDSIQPLTSKKALIASVFLIFSLYLFSGNLGYSINGTIQSYLPPKKASSNLLWVNNLEEGFQKAQEENKNIFIDFTGVTCTNCRWMETNIFTINSIEEKLQKYVLVSLYTDSGKDFNQKRQYQIERFKTAALPFYVILDPSDNIIGTFPGLTRDKKEFESFLDKGL